MFGGMKKLWAETALTSAIEGVIREATKGNALEVQRWYFKIKKEAYKQSLKENVTPFAIEERALGSMKSDQVQIYREVVMRLSKDGGPLEEVNEWLKTNKPV